MTVYNVLIIVISIISIISGAISTILVFAVGSFRRTVDELKLNLKELHNTKVSIAYYERDCANLKSDMSRNDERFETIMQEMRTQAISLAAMAQDIALIAQEIDRRRLTDRRSSKLKGEIIDG